MMEDKCFKLEGEDCRHLRAGSATQVVASRNRSRACRRHCGERAQDADPGSCGRQALRASRRTAPPGGDEMARRGNDRFLPGSSQAALRSLPWRADIRRNIGHFIPSVMRSPSNLHWRATIRTYLGGIAETAI